LELKKGALMCGQDACSAEGYEEFLDWVEVHYAVRETGDCFDEPVVRARANSNAKVLSRGLGPFGNSL